MRIPIAFAVFLTRLEGNFTVEGANTKGRRGKEGEGEGEDRLLTRSPNSRGNLGHISSTLAWADDDETAKLAFLEVAPDLSKYSAAVQTLVRRLLTI